MTDLNTIKVLALAFAIVTTHFAVIENIELVIIIGSIGISICVIGIKIQNRHNHD